jgi:predicted HAD superfamily phosphohydrolase YqeG
MIKRIFYSLSQAWRYRRKLISINQNQTQQAESISSLDCQELYQQGIRALILDFDGVLANHGEIGPAEFLKSWLAQAIMQFGENKLFILSNNPIPGRLAYFATHYPQIQFVNSPRKKPYPDGVLKISQLAGLSSDKILLVDDRLLTGILAAVIANAKVMYITQPLIDWRKRPIREAFFASLRWLERHLI